MYLLDTNALIIFMHEDLADGSLSMPTKETMITEDRLFVSIISLWEIAIKKNLGKLALDSSILDLENECIQQGIEIIPLKSTHIEHTLDVPLLNDHKDPFDRLIISTTLAENLTLISSDMRMRKEEYKKIGLQVIY